VKKDLLEEKLKKEKVHWGGRFFAKEEEMVVREKVTKEINGEFAALN
jgi:hypothetical protein